MTRHKPAQTGLGTPQPRQLWLTAALRMLAMLVLHVASTLQMIRRREPVNATQPTPTDMPQAKTDTQSKETNAVSQDSQTAPSVSLGSRQAIHPPQFSTGGGKQRTVAGNEGKLPPPVRSTGGGGSPRLRGETEGAQAKPTATSASVHPMHAFPAKAGTQPSSEKSAQRAHHLNP